MTIENTELKYCCQSFKISAEGNCMLPQIGCRRCDIVGTPCQPYCPHFFVVPSCRRGLSGRPGPLKAWTVGVRLESCHTRKLVRLYSAPPSWTPMSPCPPRPLPTPSGRSPRLPPYWIWWETAGRSTWPPWSPWMGRRSSAPPCPPRWIPPSSGDGGSPSEARLHTG